MLDTGEGNAAEISGAKAVETVSERSATPVSDGDLPYSSKGSLAAVCNASQSFARIHEDFRVKSFKKKQLKEYGDDKFGMSGQHYLPVHAVAAIRIQNKFRCWKGRREFLIIKQRMVEIQVHCYNFFFGCYFTLSIYSCICFASFFFPLLSQVHEY